MEETSTENAKISDSGYSNTCSNSQSHTSSGSSLSRNSNRSASSGYHGGNISVFSSCIETLPKPIAKRKDKGHKKKKSKSAHVESILLNSTAANAIPVAPLTNVTGIGSVEACKPAIDNKTEEKAVVELVDATDPGVHNNNNLAAGPEAGLDTKRSPIEDSSLQSTEDVYAVISMHDGVVLHATPTLLAALGYQKGSWTGKLFINFLDPRDKSTLTDRIASEIASFRDPCSSGANNRKASIYCRLRRCTVFQCTSNTNNNGHQTGFDGQYVPYRIDLMIQNFHKDSSSTGQKQIMILVASFHRVYSAYKVSEETIIPTVFTTRHTATCHLSFIDPDVVQYLGYLPQDMIDRSLFDFYHPEDLPLIKDIYETMINMSTLSISSFRSKPYRFIIQNGCFVVIETEWSSFINPWTKKLEFVIGKHRVLKGPTDPNIFRPPGDSKNNLLANISVEILKEAKIIEKEIKELFVQGVQKKHNACQVIDNDWFTWKKELTTFIESAIQESKSTAPIKDSIAVDDRSFSGLLNPGLQEHDSVMLGEISPHHEYFDSKSSSETPPSYNQLNYHDNIERFFNSNIDVNANNGPYASDEENLHSSANSSDEPDKNNISRPELKCTSSTNGSGNSGSAENLSSESNNQQSFGSNRETSNTTSNNSTNNDGRRLKPPVLTESLLNRHNEDMEKLMVQKHREQKKEDKRAKSSLNEQKSKIAEQPSGSRDNLNKTAGNRLKRTGSQIWEGDNNFKISRYDDTINGSSNTKPITTMPNIKFTTAGIEHSAATGIAKVNPNINACPSTFATMPSTSVTQQCFSTQNACSQATTRFPSLPQMFPVYYLPMSQPRDNLPLSAIPQDHSGQPNLFAQATPYCFVQMPYVAPAMPPLVYPPVIGAPAPPTMMYRSYIVPETVATATPISVVPQPAQSCPPANPPAAATTATVVSPFDLKRPNSRATSVKGEPSSTIAMSESSKKICSPSGIMSSCVSHEDGCLFSICLNKSCDSSSNTDQRHTTSSSELQKTQPAYQKSKETRRVFGIVRKEPPWIEGIKLTPELIYQYQIRPKDLEDVLKTDMEFLKQSKQPNIVNDQLGQLFFDLDLEGLGSKLILEKTGTNSADDSSSNASQRLKKNRTFA
ncbi:period circadian protein isoform X2 [Phymastichus coffea]|uniref:period circadian protein isoform X2 n=1 Tax=Phymastichus coffea TaxID=108790 RepID=UPI00273B71D2|nr:period circadian protein isoform X2 [Phymastichus coffea]